MTCEIDRRRFVAWGAGSIATALLGGCGGSGSSGTGGGVSIVSGAMAAPTPTSTPTPTPTSTPAPTPSSSPTSTLATTRKQVVLVQTGDSIGIGLGSDYWAAIDHLGLDAEVAVHNVSVSGRSMQEGYDRRAELLSFYEPDKLCILVIQQGTNDLGRLGSNGMALYQNVAVPFVSAARDAGFYVVLNTLLPRTDWNWDWNAAKESQRQAYNVLVRANTADADVVNDLAADPVIGDAVNPGTSPFYTDALHLSLLGQQRVAILDAAALTPLLAKSIRTGRSG